MNNPKVSFLIITYNQEHLVEDALRGAVSQDYDNLEIIVSDDCSSDATFEKIKAFFDNYDGPHQVVVNRNETNKGIGSNLNVAVSLSSGDLIFVSAGDDVSLPNRVSSVVRFWAEEGGRHDLIASFLYDMSYCGAVLGVIGVDDLSKYKSVDDWLSLGHPKLIGAAHTWTRSFFINYGGVPDGVVAEDMVMAFRAIANAKAVTIKIPLVNYRRGGTTGKKRRGSVADVKKSFVNKVRNTKIELLDMLKTAASCSPSPELLIYLAGLYQRECYVERIYSNSYSELQKLRLLMSSRNIKIWFRIRVFFYAVYPWLFKPFFWIKSKVVK
ncbi:glycosyltransferase family 2 protein [Crenobacter intestini]|uniref:Glycosyltransferase family 2 protein n=1 Tax=Crenobacter intestini TaxID=2563443 RepID=A0A4T0UWI1_9NEIS|nr:glycosyltransferase family A protein [Crenobacter intestini]TIC83442.1 glycosyltransferase family 2 protein [Crenobacter intestini]